MEEKIASNKIPRFYNDDLLKRGNAVEAIKKIVKELREGDETEQIMADGAIYALRAIKSASGYNLEGALIVEENFKISIEKACPACSTECPNFEIESTSFYGESFYKGRIAFREYFCRNADLCGKLWTHLNDYKNGLEGH